MHYNRWQEDIIKKALLSRRVLALVGCRQCGKTTLAKTLSASDSIYRTLDDATLMDAAMNDPYGFVDHGNNLMIIDEIQRVPTLLQAVKLNVDENQNPGRFLLTGSANIQALPSVSESLAGRIRKIRLRPLSTGEIKLKTPEFFKNILKKKFDKFSTKNASEYSKDSYLNHAFDGGYPETLNFATRKEKRQWHWDYIQALVDHDLKDIANIKRKDGMIKLIGALSAWSSKLIDISSIGKSLSIARNTTESYINALESLYLVERVRPWYKTDYDRVGKRDKLFITDTGLMTSVLNWRFDDVRFNGELNGKLIESFVFNQLASIIDAQEDSYFLYHYRDREQREIDFIVENEDGKIITIEVKSGSVVNKDSFKHIKWFGDNLAKDKLVVGIVLYTGNNIIPFGDNLWALPISCLWE